jgi:hypothetical protein
VVVAIAMQTSSKKPQAAKATGIASHEGHKYRTLQKAHHDRTAIDHLLGLNCWEFDITPRG